MKAILTTFIIGLSFLSFSKSRISLPEYKIVSDVYDPAIPNGTCVVGGKVLIGNKGLDNSLVSTTDFEEQSVTDSSGMFRLVLSDNDSSIFFFHSGYQEIVIYNYDFKSQHAVTIEFRPQVNYTMQFVDKPIIYCYSDEPLAASILLDPKSELTFTYPQIKNNEWNFTVSEKGLTANGQNYPYLFWEGETTDLNFKTTGKTLEGYLIKTDSIVSFLENTLDAFGLNQIEKTDFITFWGPRMIQKDYALVQFLTDENYDAMIAEIEVHPKPDAMFRLFMCFTPLDNSETNLEITAPDINGFKRQGFTIVEWGGAEINPELNATTFLNR